MFYFYLKICYAKIKFSMLDKSRLFHWSSSAATSLIQQKHRRLHVSLIQEAPKNLHIHKVATASPSNGEREAKPNGGHEKCEVYQFFFFKFSILLSELRILCPNFIFFFLVGSSHHHLLRKKG